MLSPPDADLVARERNLPGLATLLDPEAFVDSLRSQFTSVRFDTAQVTYVRYRPGTDGLVAYRVAADGRPVDVYGIAHERQATWKLRNAREKRRVPAPSGMSRFVMDDLSLVVSFFPDDRRLPILPALGDTEVRRRILQKAFPDREQLWKARLETVSYHPERRYSAKLIVKGRPRAFLKAYGRPEDYDAAAQGAKAFHSTPALRISRSIGKSIWRRLLGFRWAEGRLLEDALADPQFDADEFVRIGRALSALHAQTAPGVRVRNRDAEAADAAKTAADLGYLWPPLAERALDLARRIASRIGEGPDAAAPIHGDFHAEHVLLGEQAVHVVDLDQVALGDPAADRGNFLAHLELHAVRGLLPTDRVEAMRGAFLDGYGRAARDRVGVATAAAMLRLAIEPFRDRDPDWPGTMSAILESADEALRIPAGLGATR